jgi:peptidoglycan/xylan/chitin deacetylase (PgdA/CDA1 family)
VTGVARVILRLVMLVATGFFCVSCAGADLRPTTFPGTALPLVTFVFDDGNDTDYLVGKKIFANQGAVACSAITTDWLNQKEHLTTAQAIALQEAGWEIMGHTVSHPNLRSQAPAEVEAELSRSKDVLESLDLNVTNLVYPYNKNNGIVREIASRYYRSGRGGTNSFNTGATDPYFLKSFSIKHDLGRMEEQIDRAHADRSWLIFYQHEINAKVRISDRQGTFTRGETLRLSPSGTVARYVTTLWCPIFGNAFYLVPLSGEPQPGDVVTGSTSGATARIDRVVYNERTQLAEMIDYIHRNYPDMQIVTIEQGLDLLGFPGRRSTEKKETGKANGAL